MSTASPCATILAAVVLFSALLNRAAYAAPQQTSVADQTLFHAANHDRVAAGLHPLRWDPTLAAAAHRHALLMAKSNQLSHQFPDEPPLQDRGKQAGARFSTIAENIAQGPSVAGLHTLWMNSPPHRANLLNPALNSVGISVVQSGNMYFAVQDFSTSVASLSIDEQEKEVAAQILARSQLDVDAGTPDARKTCESNRSFSGSRPAAILRFETFDLSNLPDDLKEKISSGKYHSATVGACKPSDSSEFTRFHIAVLLY